MMHSGRFFYDGMLWGHGVLGSVWFWLIVVGVVVALAAAIYLITKNRSVPKANLEAIEILDSKFAKGEITFEEYTMRKNVINEGR